MMTIGLITIFDGKEFEIQRGLDEQQQIMRADKHESMLDAEYGDKTQYVITPKQILQHQVNNKSTNQAIEWPKCAQMIMEVVYAMHPLHLDGRYMFGKLIVVAHRATEHIHSDLAVLYAHCTQYKRNNEKESSELLVKFIKQVREWVQKGIGALANRQRILRQLDGIIQLGQSSTGKLGELIKMLEDSSQIAPHSILWTISGTLFSMKLSNDSWNRVFKIQKELTHLNAIREMNTHTPIFYEIQKAITEILKLYAEQTPHSLVFQECFEGAPCLQVSFTKPVHKFQSQNKNHRIGMSFSFFCGKNPSLSCLIDTPTLFEYAQVIDIPEGIRFKPNERTIELTTTIQDGILFVEEIIRCLDRLLVADIVLRAYQQRIGEQDFDSMWSHYKNILDKVTDGVKVDSDSIRNECRSGTAAKK